MVLGLRCKLLPLVLQLELWLGLWLGLAHMRGLWGCIQALQVPYGELRERVISKVTMGVTSATVWLLLPAAIMTWKIAHGTRLVYGDCFHWQWGVGIYPRMVDLYIRSLRCNHYILSAWVIGRVEYSRLLLHCRRRLLPQVHVADVWKTNSVF